MPDFDIWSFIAGLGIFLLGISQMEGGLKNLAGKSFRHFIRTQTHWAVENKLNWELDVVFFLRMQPKLLHSLKNRSKHI